MKHSADLSPTASHLATALTVGSIAVLMLGVQPILLGALVDSRQLTLDGVGLLAMLEIMMLGIGVALGGTLPLQRFRLIAILSSTLAAAADFGTAGSQTEAQFMITRGLAGLGEGVALWICVSIIVRCPRPEPKAGLFAFIQTVAQAGLAGVLAAIVLPAFSWHGGFATLAGTALISAGLALLLPASLPRLQAAAISYSKWSTTKALPLVVAFLQMAAIGALWAYLEPLGQAIGLGPKGAQFVISAVLCAQLAGSAAGTLMVRRIGTTHGLVVSTLAIAAAALAMHGLSSGQFALFTGFAMLFGAAWMFAFPFQVSLGFACDPTGHVSTLIPALQLLGVAFGPLIASTTVQGNARSAALVSCIFGVLVISLLTGSHRRITAAVATARSA
jgi:MFS family permease